MISDIKPWNISKMYRKHAFTVRKGNPPTEEIALRGHNSVMIPEDTEPSEIKWKRQARNNSWSSRAHVLSNHMCQTRYWALGSLILFNDLAIQRSVQFYRSET